ncbi:hypothetical protein [Halonotius roseus]|nr:hypothetical protein [Halonotius roseus]
MVHTPLEPPFAVAHPAILVLAGTESNAAVCDFHASAFAVDDDYEIITF